MTAVLCDIDLEHALVAEALRKYERFAAFGLVEEHFESARHRQVLRAVSEAHELGETGLEAVARALQRAGALESVGGQRGLAEIAAGPGAGFVADAERLKDLSRLRGLRDGAIGVAKLAGDGDFAAALAALQDVQQRALDTVSGKVLTAGDLGRAAIQGVADKARCRRVNAGLPGIRHHIGDFLPGSMTVIAGDTNCGKSSFVLELLFESCKHHPVGLISVEDPDDVTGARLLHAVCGVSARNIARGKLDSRDMSDLSRGVHELDAMGGKLLYADCMGGNDVDVCAAMFQMRARGARLIAVDYIQEIEPSQSQQDRRNDIRWIGKRLKFTARRNDQALVLVSQLSRPSDRQTGKRPTKHMIKESGDISNQAENILMLWREEENDTSPINVTAVKVKHGGVGAEWQMQRTSGTNGRLVEVTTVYDER